MNYRVPEILHTSLYYKAHSRALFTLYGLVLKEFRVSFRQFFYWRSPIVSFFRVIKYASLGVFRIVLGRAVKQSYAYTGEDRLLESMLKKQIEYNGFYVDVGCNDPRFLSNTFLFYRRGWSGLCVDANEKLIRKFRKVRPRDISICCLVSNDENQREFYEMTNDVLSTTEKAFVNEYLEQGQRITNRKFLQPKSLSKILDENDVPPQFDILSIDAEEHDFMVLQSLDFSRYSPNIIIIEAEDFNPDIPQDHPIYKFLVAHQYNFEGSILKNLYFRKER